MKKYIKNLLLFITVAAMLVSGLNAYASDEELLYEKFNYQEEFEYSDEMVGHALKASVPKIFFLYETELTYRPVEFNSEYLLALFDELYDEYSASNTTEEIVEALITYMSNNVSEFLKYGSYKDVTVSGVATGSGVVISDDGYIASNAHVVSMTEDEKVDVYIAKLEENCIEDLEAIVSEIEEYGVELTEDDIYSLWEIILSASTEDASIISEESMLMVAFAGPDGNTSLDEDMLYEAELEKIGTQEGKDGLTRDTAILKVDIENMVSLPLSQSEPEANSDIFSAGYPGAAEEIFESYGSDASTLSVSINPGKISRIVDIDSSEYSAIEISSTLAGGNSGGPSVDNKLNIEGLNTYISEADNRYAYMVSAEYVRDLSKKFDIEQGETSKTFFTGLQMLQQGYGASALECFERVRELQPNTPYIDKLIVTAEKAPQDSYSAVNNDENADNKEGKSNELLRYIIIGASAMCVLIVTIILVFMLLSRKKRKKRMEAEIKTPDTTVVHTPPPPTTPPTYKPPINTRPTTGFTHSEHRPEPPKQPVQGNGKSNPFRVPDEL